VLKVTSDRSADELHLPPVIAHPSLFNLTPPLLEATTSSAKTEHLSKQVYEMEDSAESGQGINYREIDKKGHNSAYDDKESVPNTLAVLKYIDRHRDKVNTVNAAGQAEVCDTVSTSIIAEESMGVSDKSKIHSAHIGQRVKPILLRLKIHSNNGATQREGHEAPPIGAHLVSPVKECMGHFGDDLQPGEPVSPYTAFSPLIVTPSHPHLFVDHRGDELDDKHRPETSDDRSAGGYQEKVKGKKMRDSSNTPKYYRTHYFHS
jgi:hypothetical protein